MKTFSATILIFAFFLYACEPVEEGEKRVITYPGAIAPEIIISKSEDQYEKEVSSFEVWIYDKSRKGLEIIDGGASINGFQLAPYRYTVDNIPYYTLPDSVQVDFELDEDYVCTIVLSDGATYNSTVHSQSTGLDSLIVPAVHNRDSSMTLQWHSVDSSAEMLLQAWYYYNFNNESGWGTESYLIGNDANGSYTIEAALFTQVAGIQFVDFTLSSTVYGEVSTEFDERSRIISSIDITRRVTLQ